MRLRAYQNDILNEVRQAYKDGYKAPCIVAPCGAGKSVMLAEIAKSATKKGNRVLFIVHRKELCEQIEKTFRNWGVEMRLCRIGMVQSISRRLPKLHKPTLIMTDENHHSPAASYKKIYNYFSEVKRVGVTATPARLDGSGLRDVNDKLIIGVSAKWLIDNNYLAPYDYYSPSITDLTGIRTSHGEYMASDIEAKLNSKTVYGDVIHYYRSLAKGSRAICYCASIKHSKNMAEQFNKAGIQAEHIDGETPKNKRADIISAFRTGQIKILCNVDLISEGFDVPDCTAVILLRPTKSLTLYIQQSMRCMRYKEGKKAIIIDHVGNYARFGLPDMDREWTLDTIDKGNKKNDKREDSELKIRQCPNCFYTHEAAAICPSCDYEYPIKARTIDEIKEAMLEKITGFTLDYSSPNECNSMDELLAYAKKKGYKKGWAYYQAVNRGFIAK